jgi:hypothetical protein
MAMDASRMEHMLRLEIEVKDALICGNLQIFNIDAWLELLYMSLAPPCFRPGRICSQTW